MTKTKADSLNLTTYSSRSKLLLILISICTERRERFLMIAGSILLEDTAIHVHAGEYQPGAAVAVIAVKRAVASVGPKNSKLVTMPCK